VPVLRGCGGAVQTPLPADPFLGKVLGKWWQKVGKSMGKYGENEICNEGKIGNLLVSSAQNLLWFPFFVFPFRIR
jgi:hypothetical protein